MEKAYFTASGAAGLLPLAKDGATAYVIVRGAHASETECKAAEELKKYLGQITGAAFPLAADDAPLLAREIVVGKTNRGGITAEEEKELGEDGFVIRTEGERLYLIGGSVNGTLYAVYGFLEDYLGCRFYTGTFEKIPAHPTVFLSPIEEDKQIPTFLIRTIYWRIVLGDPVLAAKRKVNNDRTVYAWPGGCHTLAFLAGTGGGCGPDPCLSDEKTFTDVLAAAKKSLSEKPGANRISLSQSDGGEGAACHCPRCMERVEKYGWSGHYLLFVNRVADALKDEYPDLLIHTFAYSFTKEPPKGGVRAADNVFVQICTDSSCFAHPLTECREPVDFPAMLSAWGKVCNYMSLWDYTINFPGYLFPFPNWAALRPNARLFAENNVKTLFEQGVYGGWKNGEFDYLRVYLLCRLAWDPFMTDEQYYGYMDEFLADFYGPGWRHIRAYIDYTTRIVQKDHIRMYTPMHAEVYAPRIAPSRRVPKDMRLDANMLRAFREVDWDKYADYGGLTVKPHEFIVNGYKYFEDAASEAETDEQRRQITRSSLQLDFMKSHWLHDRMWIGEKNLRSLFADAVKEQIDAGALGEEEGTALCADFDGYIGPKLRADYAAYNRALAERMLAYDCPDFKEAWSLHNPPLDELHFEEYPTNQNDRPAWF